MNYFDTLHQEFSKESDRAAVILTASILDELLKNILAAKLVPVSSSNDELFDGANAPLGTFSSRIECAYRLGIISVRFARDMHLIRKIRNEFAHNIRGSNFDDVRVRSRVKELSNSNGILQRSEEFFKDKELSTRDEFLEDVSWMIFHLNNMASSVESMEPAADEWGYRLVREDVSPDTSAHAPAHGPLAIEDAVTEAIFVQKDAEDEK